MNELAGKYAGMDRFEARKAIVADLKEIGIVDHIEKMVTASRALRTFRCYC